MPVDLNKPPYVAYHVIGKDRKKHSPVFYMDSEPVAREHLKAVRDGKASIYKAVVYPNAGLVYLRGEVTGDDLTLTWIEPTEQQLRAIEAQGGHQL